MKRAVIAVVLAVILLPAVGLAVFISQFDPNRYAPNLINAVASATGRTLTLGGPIQLALSLTPTIEVNDVSLANPPGFADPNLLTLDRLEARIALFPLLAHKVDILKLVLVGPNITLERDAAGQADWDLAPSAAGSAPPNGAATATASQGGYKIALEAVEIQNGLVSFKNAATPTTIALTSFTGTADSPSSPLTLNATAIYNKTPFTLAGVVGPVERFSGVGSGPWPVNLTLTTQGATATVQGSLAEPRDAAGYDLAVNASIPALETLAAELPPNLLNGAKLPPIHGITASARIVDQNATLPAIDNFSLKATASDLSTLRPGLTLSTLDIEMPALDSPAAITATGSIDGAALSFKGDFGAPQLLLNPAWLPATTTTNQASFPVAVQAQAGDAKFSVTGGIATPAKLAGVALAVTATIPDLSKLSGLAGAPLPAWKNINLQTTFIDPGGLGLMAAAGLDSLVYTMDNTALGGDASLYFGAKPRLQAAITAQQINLDPILAALPTQASSAAPPSQPAPARYVIPNTPLPVAALKNASADIQFSANTLIYRQATYTAIQSHAVLANGVLTINPLTAQLPGGSVSATATLDATKDPAAATLSVNAPALALGPFLKALNLPATAQGTMQAAMTLSGTGDSPHAIAATANGQLGLAMVNGIVDGSVLDAIFGSALRTVGLPERLVGRQGPVAVRCFGLRVDSSNGTGAVRALTLDSNRLLVQGGGTLNFGTETLDLVIRSQLHVIGNQVGIPVEVSGSFANPKTSVATLGALQDAAKTAIGIPVSVVQTVLGSNNILNNVLNSVGLGSAGDVCPAALALGRLGKPGPAPAAPATASSPGVAEKLISGPKSLLNSLFGN